MPDVLFILLLALVIFGPKRLPKIARQVGMLMAQFRQMSSEFRSQLESEMLQIELEERQQKLPEQTLQPSEASTVQVEAAAHTTSS